MLLLHQQTLAADASVEMPVTFFVDPKIVDDEDTKNISEITLSYTFYRSDRDPGAAGDAAGLVRDRDARRGATRLGARLWEEREGIDGRRAR